MLIFRDPPPPRWPENHVRHRQSWIDLPACRVLYTWYISYVGGGGGWSVTCSMGKFAFLTMKSIRFFISFVFQILINSYERCAYDISINAENSEKVRKQTISVLTEVCFKCRFFTLVHQRIVKNDTFSSNYLLIPKIKKNNKKSKFIFLRRAHNTKSLHEWCMFLKSST